MGIPKFIVVSIPMRRVSPMKSCCIESGRRL